ncbi:Y-family DNA polymerase [Ferrimonas marina]|uniref:DNA polymerase V n=1 Tax=Ferrimonas marina TaxID=299255 RepID=A0A1M5ULB8_9GAMM|nr:Y-family DNA polymerase [Ferrimonas marina]SHH63720.1 DNA polymerase V [Ferrimonas marina]
MIYLIDANAFYCGAEASVDPSLRNLTNGHIVLTNSDGCVCAATKPALAILGKKFQPYFQIEGLVEQHGIRVHSSNYELYAAVSQRMNETLRSFGPARHHVYSIDETFQEYYGITDHHQLARAIRQRVWKEQRIPMGVGVGPTYVLAKAANHAAKRLEGYRGIAVIDNDHERRRILAQMKLTDVWGIGSRLAARMEAIGLRTALDLSQQQPQQMRRQFSVNVERIVRELNGELAMGFDEVPPPAKEICSSLTVKARLTDLVSFRQAMALRVEYAAERLRRQGQMCEVISVFAYASQGDRERGNGFSASKVIQLPVATDDTRTLVSKVMTEVEAMWRPGARVAKHGVILSGLSNASSSQMSLFEAPPANSGPLMKAMDDINARFGSGALQTAATGMLDRAELNHRQFLSKNPLTRWSDIPKARC